MKIKKSSMFFFSVCFALISLIFISLPKSSDAASIISPVSVLSNTMGETASGEAVNMINQNGLLSPFITGVTDFDTYIAGNPQHQMLYGGTEFWSRAGVNSGMIQLDLGANYFIDRMAFWNEDAVGVSRMALYASTLNNFATSTNLGFFSPIDNIINLDYGAEVFGFTGNLARYIWMDVSSTDLWAGQPYVSIGEVAFATSAVPEPSTYLLLGSGIAGLALWRRKRKLKA